MGAHVILHVAKFRELLATCCALKHLVFATCLSIQILHFSEALRFLDGTFSELSLPLFLTLFLL